jgi:uncharacterized protein (DUF849 family)
VLVELAWRNFGTYPDDQGHRAVPARRGARVLERSRNWVFRKTFQDIEGTVRTLVARGTCFEFECYGVGLFYTLARRLSIHAMRVSWCYV